MNKYLYLGLNVCLFNVHFPLIKKLQIRTVPVWVSVNCTLVHALSLLAMYIQQMRPEERTEETDEKNGSLCYQDFI